MSLYYPNQRKNMNAEVLETFGHGPEHAWNMQKFREEHDEPYAKAVHEFKGKSNATEHAFNMQKFREEHEKPHAMATHEFMLKSPAAKQAWDRRAAIEVMTPTHTGLNVNARHFVPIKKGGKSKKNRKKTKRNHRKKTKSRKRKTHHRRR